ncbi:hypothetical protein [Arthrobacter sp. A5]
MAVRLPTLVHVIVATIVRVVVRMLPAAVVQMLVIENRFRGRTAAVPG